LVSFDENNEDLTYVSSLYQRLNQDCLMLESEFQKLEQEQFYQVIMQIEQIL